MACTFFLNYLKNINFISVSTLMRSYCKSCHWINNNCSFNTFFFDCLHGEDLYAGLLLRQQLEAILFSMQKEAGVVFESNRYSPCVIRAIKYIRRHLSAQLTLAEIAENAFVSKSTLTKHFRHELSKSVAEYVTDLIMFEAGQRLLKTNLSVLAVSEKYGFSDQFYFSRRFKQKFGCSPQQYRKAALT